MFKILVKMFKMLELELARRSAAKLIKIFIFTKPDGYQKQKRQRNREPD
jgi:hypothetical protein